MNKGGCTYIVTNQYNTVLYVGVTAELRARIWEHKSNAYPKSFTSRYKCYKIVWYECFSRIESAIEREKQLKGGSRAAKEGLIHEMNPQWKDLWDEIQDL